MLMATFSSADGIPAPADVAPPIEGAPIGGPGGGGIERRDEQPGGTRVPGGAGGGGEGNGRKEGENVGQKWNKEDITG